LRPRNRPETVPLGLVEEVSLGPALGDLGLHRLDGRGEGMTHGRRVYAMDTLVP
jgi:hypothetical protein